MPHCQKEFAKPPVSSKQKKAAQQAKREVDKAKEAKKERERDPEEREAELAQVKEAEKKEANAKRLAEAKKSGNKAFKASEMVEALACYSVCIEIEPEDHRHWSNRSEVQRQLGNFEEALADATQCTALDPKLVKGWARVGLANLALDRFDAAEEAFQQGLLIEPDSTACLDGLKNTLKARETSREEREFDRLLKDLQGLEPEQLQVRALERGVGEDKVKAALRSKNAQEALVSLITAHKYLVDLIMEDLQGLELAELRDRALQDGMEEEDVAEAEGMEDPKDALKGLLVKYISNDLVDTATELQAEAAETYEDSSDGEGEDVGLDLEIVAGDESDMQLAKNDVFIPGAYIDPKHGELVLPNGTRLGNRALSKFYRQRARPTNERQLALHGSRQMTVSQFSAKVMRQQERRMMIKKQGLSMNDSSAISTNLMRSMYKAKEADNKAMRAIVHHWGGGGGGSHYHSAGTKAYNQGNKVKGIILRHSTQGAKLQAARTVTRKALNERRGQ